MIAKGLIIFYLVFGCAFYVYFNTLMKYIGTDIIKNTGNFDEIDFNSLKFKILFAVVCIMLWPVVITYIIRNQ